MVGVPAADANNSGREVAVENNYTQLPIAISGAGSQSVINRETLH